jgi:hypothetical protein
VNIETLLSDIQRELKYIYAVSEERLTLLLVSKEKHVRFEVYTAVTMKNGVFWDVTPCGSRKNGCFGGT